MTNAVFNLVTAITRSPATESATVASGKDAPTTEDFQRTLVTRLNAIAAAGSDKIGTARNAPPGPLEAKIAKMLTNGASEADVVRMLSKQLAAAVAKLLGTSNADATRQLQKLLGSALKGPGSLTQLGSIADRARTLAQRFDAISDLALQIAGQVTGQHRIADDVLDAKAAKDSSALADVSSLTAGIVAAPSSQIAGTSAPATQAAAVAAAALHARSSAVATATATSGAAVATQDSTSRSGAAVPDSLTRTASAGHATHPVSEHEPLPFGASSSALAGAPLAALPLDVGTKVLPGDERRVAFDQPATSGGGDTALGRILTRAALAADARDASESDAGDSTLTADASAQNHSGAANGIDGALESFVKSFAAAVGDAAAPSDPLSTHHEATLDAAAAPPAAALSDMSNVPTFVPTVAPFSIDRIAPLVAPPAVAPATADDRASIVDQVLRGAFMRNTAESSEMRLTLVPETLGDVSVKLIVNGGNVTAHVLAQTADVRDALVAAQPQLTKSLADAGLKLQSFNVDLSGNGFAGFSQQQSQNRAPNGRSLASHDNAIDDASDAALEAIPSFAPPASLHADAGDFNYLV